MNSAPPAAPPGTFVPGTKVQVGNHRVVIQRYLSEGGFAHVYVVTYPSTDGGRGNETAVLKRVAVPDKEALANMRTEVETMKKLKGHRHIVTYIDSHASQLKQGGYEVFLLMEWCQGGGLIDFMNTRLKHRLTEPEILNIFGDAAEGLACMHYLKPPLLHRDLKIENILIAQTGGTTIYKLCDFGSSAPPRPAATSAAEGKLIEDDVQRHTTMQYRSPEMIDVYRNRPIDEKSDMWALGVMLYKLCYYTTPFEEKGQMAILNASFKYPPHPVFSDRLKLLIARMLTEEPRKRPTIYDVLSDVCSMRGKAVPIKDIYAHRTASEARNTQQLPPREIDVTSPPVLGASIAPPEAKKQTVPEVAPMRRGRPTSTIGAQKSVPQAASLGGKGVSNDPFAALDSTNYDTRAKAVDELSGRFPAVQDFSLLQSKDTKFKFDNNSPKPSQDADLSQRVTQALADEAFGSLRPQPASAPRPTEAASRPQAQAAAGSAATKAAAAAKIRSPELPRVQSFQSPPVEKPVPSRPAVNMVSTGTSTDDLPPAPPPKPPRPEAKDRPIWRVPLITRSPQLSGQTEKDAADMSKLSLQDLGRRPSYRQEVPQSPSSSRPSLEGGRPSSSLVVEQNLQRSHSASSRPSHRRSQSQNLLQTSADATRDEPIAIDDNVDFLRSMEGQDQQKSHRRSSTKIRQHFKNASMSSVPKGLFGGRAKLGETLKKFEGGAKSPGPAMPVERESYMDITPPNEAALAVDDDILEGTQDLSPEMRRELERRQLSQEERRVAEAAAEYRLQAAGGRPQRGARASAIQDRVRSLLDESGRQPPIKRTAVGYGQYTASAPAEENGGVASSAPASTRVAPAIASKPAMAASQPGPPLRAQTIASGHTVSSSTRPNAPPKPVALRTGGSNMSQPATATARSASAAAAASSSSQHQTQSPGPGDEDWETAFARRYPSISLDSVETEITRDDSRPAGRPLRIRDV